MAVAALATAREGWLTALTPRSSMAGGMWNRVVARALLVGFLGGVLGWSASDAGADPGVAAVDLNADARALVAQLTAERAINLANARGQADAAQDELYKQLNDKDRALRAAHARAAGNATALVGTQGPQRDRPAARGVGRCAGPARSDARRGGEGLS